MSSFGTFLTTGPSRRHRVKVDLHQKFLRQRNKYFPKAIRPKVNVFDPVMNKSNQQQNQDTMGFEKTMPYKNCSQIVPTVGLTNLIFYDCHNQSSVGKSMDDSISQLMPLPSLIPATEYRHGSQFFIPEILMGSSRNSHGTTSSDATIKSQDCMDFNFDQLARTSQPLSSVQDFTLTSNGGSNFLPSYTSFEMDLNRRAKEMNMSNDMLQSDIFSFEIDLDDKANPIRNDLECADDDTFEINLKRQMNQNISSDIEHQGLLSVSGLSPQINSPDWHVLSNVTQSDDESMEKFGVSSCSDVSLDISDIGGNFYAAFIPLHTSTPISKRKTTTWENTKNTQKEWSTSGLLDISDKEFFSNQREEEKGYFADKGPHLSFPFSDTNDHEKHLNNYFF